MSFNSADFARFDHFRVAELAAGVIHVEVHRPKKLNAWAVE